MRWENKVSFDCLLPQ